MLKYRTNGHSVAARRRNNSSPTKPFCNFGAKLLKPSLDTSLPDKRRIGARLGRATKGHQMVLTFSNSRRCGLMVATALMLGLLTTVCQAYTMEQQQMCSGDAMRLCSSEIPNVERITACMEQRRDELSDGCKAVFEVDTPAPATESSVSETPSPRPSKPLNLTPKFKHG
jgi:hypothetical protein